MTSLTDIVFNLVGIGLMIAVRYQTGAQKLDVHLSVIWVNILQLMFSSLAVVLSIMILKDIIK